jgi:hypothetical protein
MFMFYVYKLENTIWGLGKINYRNNNIAIKHAVFDPIFIQYIIIAISFTLLLCMKTQINTKVTYKLVELNEHNNN